MSCLCNNTANFVGVTEPNSKSTKNCIVLNYNQKIVRKIAASLCGTVTEMNFTVNVWKTSFL